MSNYRNMGGSQLTQLDLRRIKNEYFPGLDPAQIALFLYHEKAPRKYTAIVEKVLSEAGLRRRRPPSVTRASHPVKGLDRPRSRSIVWR